MVICWFFLRCFHGRFRPLVASFLSIKCGSGSALIATSATGGRAHPQHAATIEPGGGLNRRFLHSLAVTRHVTSAISIVPSVPILRIKPNVKILAGCLVSGNHRFTTVRVSNRDITCLRGACPALPILRSSFLAVSLAALFSNHPFILANGCPCSVSSRVFFHLLTRESHVPYYAKVVRHRITLHLTSPPRGGTCNVLDILLRT